MCWRCCGQRTAGRREEVSTAAGITVGAALQRRTVIETCESTSASRTAGRRLSRPSPMTGASARGRDIVLAPPRAPVYNILFRFFFHVLLVRPYPPPPPPPIVLHTPRPYNISAPRLLTAPAAHRPPVFSAFAVLIALLTCAARSRLFRRCNFSRRPFSSKTTTTITNRRLCRYIAPYTRIIESHIL